MIPNHARRFREAAKCPPVECGASFIPLMLGIIGLVFSAGTAHGEAWQLEPQLSLGLGYNDNRSLSPDTPAAIRNTRVAGDLALRRMTGTADLKALVRLDAAAYSGKDKPRDTFNQLYGFSSRISPRDELTQWGVEGNYRRDTLLRTTQLVYQPDDVAIDPTADVDNALVRKVEVTRGRLVMRPSMARRLTERLSLNLLYDYNEIDFDKSMPGLVEFTDQTVTGKLIYSLTEQDRLSARVEANRFRAMDDERKFDSTTVVTNIEHLFSETTRFNMDAGVVNTKYDTPTESGDNDGIMLRAEASKLFGRVRFASALGRKRYPSGSGDTVQTDELVFNMFYQLTETMRFSMRARLFENVSLREDNPDVNRRYLSFSPQLRWRLTDWWTLDITYQYTRQKRDIDLQSADSNEVNLSLVYTQPISLD